MFAGLVRYSHLAEGLPSLSGCSAHKLPGQWQVFQSRLKYTETICCSIGLGVRRRVDFQRGGFWQPRVRLRSAPFRLRLAPFQLRLAPFRVCFGSVSGPFRGVGWGRDGVGERGFCKGKENITNLTSLNKESEV